ncbi:MAG: hypothetical protein KAX31_07450 [Thermoplasmata archaeon]|nr:hypothetical protein [Thermoplasmata archaeon]
MMEIEFYINTDKGKVLSNQQVCGSIQHFVRDVFIGLSDKEKGMKKQLERIAKQCNAKLETYDVRGRRHRLRAQSKGVKHTPTVIIDNHKFEDDFEMSDIMIHLGLDNSVPEHKIDFNNYICPRCQSANIKIYADLSGYCNECNESFMKGVI